MLATVEFDDQCGLTARKIREVRADLKLPDELVATELSVPDDTPEAMFGLCLVATQRARPRD